MNLKYKFEFMEIADEIVAVPTGDNSQEFHGILKINETSKIILEMLADGLDENEIVEKLNTIFNQGGPDIKNSVHSFIEALINEEILTR